MNRRKFIADSSAIGLIPMISGFPVFNYLENGKNEIKKESGVPKMSIPTLANSIWYIGHLMSILISGDDTNGSFALMHGFEMQGLEPPPHTHTREDESFYVMDGEINYTVGNNIFNAKKGNWVFLPRNIQHSFKVVTKQAEVLIHLSPGGFEGYFREMSEPAKELVIPPHPQGPPDVKKIVETAMRYGILFPEEIMKLTESHS